jgi:hypothetical protein
MNIKVSILLYIWNFVKNSIPILFYLFEIRIFIISRLLTIKRFQYPFTACFLEQLIHYYTTYINIFGHLHYVTVQSGRFIFGETYHLHVLSRWTRRL